MGFDDCLFVHEGVGYNIVTIGYISMARLCKSVLVVTLWMVTMNWF